MVIVTAMSQKQSPGFSGKNRGVTPSVAAPGVTHPSDATESIYVYNSTIINYSSTQSLTLRCIHVCLLRQLLTILAPKSGSGVILSSNSTGTSFPVTSP